MKIGQDTKKGRRVTDLQRLKTAGVGAMTESELIAAELDDALRILAEAFGWERVDDALRRLRPSCGGESGDDS